MGSFKNKFPMEKRKEEALRIRKKYPDRIPVIVEKAPNADLPDIDKHKFLIPCDLTVGQFVYVIRKRIVLEPEKALFLFVGNTLPPTAMLMAELYKNHVDEDSFLYIVYQSESCFGNI